MERLANPLRVKQAPDARALNKTTILKVDSQVLSTPPFAQEYFEPGVNTKLTRRSKPKTNYSLPSDMPTYPIGFVPTNQYSGALGEEPPMIKVKESAPADLIEVFARINAEQQILAAQPKYGVDVGSMIIKEYATALKELKSERQREMMMAEGFTEEETEKAIDSVRMEKAVEVAKAPVKGVSVEAALSETFGKYVEVPEGKRAIVVPEEKLSKAEKLAKATMPEVLAGKQATLKDFVKKSGE